MDGVSRLKGWLLDLVFPLTCAGCGSEGVLLCGECREGLERRPPSCFGCNLRNFTGILCARCRRAMPLRRFLAPFSYRDPAVRALIHRWKYGGLRDVAKLLAEEAAAHLAAYRIRFPRGTLLVPIPLHPTRERQRGFNQSRLLAQELSRRLDLAVAEPLTRTRATDQQTDMKSYDQRRENMAGAFAIRDPEATRNRRVILVDDVSTSGATLAEAAGVLRRAGCRTVWAIVVAQG